MPMTPGTDSDRRDALVITGPTGTGKTALAITVAERLRGAVISADSRQVYREMDLGTAKPGAEARERVPHYGLDLVAPDEPYSAGRFARDAWRWIREIRDRNRVPLVVGGTGFFIRALLDPLSPEPDLQTRRRRRLRRYLSDRSVAELKKWMSRLDPDRYCALQDEGGSQRLTRALEVTLLSGYPQSWWFEQPPETARLSACVFCLWMERDMLYQRLDRRFDRMLESGLLEEVARLRERYPPNAPGLNAVGYRELRRYLDGELTVERAAEQARISTRNYARRQITWLRHQLPDHAIRLDASRAREELAEEIVGVWRRRTRPSPTGSSSG